MKRIRILLLASLVLLLAACAGPQPALSPTASSTTPATATETAGARTVPPSLTPSANLPAVIPTAKPKITREPTETRPSLRATAPPPSATPPPKTTVELLPLPSRAALQPGDITPVFPTAADWGYFYLSGTATPIATPPGGQTYALKAWSEADAFELVRAMNEHAYRIDIPSAGDFRGSFAHGQRAVNLLIREALLHYPDIHQREQMEWLLAFSETLQQSRALDDWIVSAIGQRLNDGGMDPADLNRGLAPLGFEVFVQRKEYPEKGVLQDVSGGIANLFGDGRTGYVLYVRNTTDYAGSLYMAVAQTADGSFQTEKIFSNWMFPYDGGTNFDVQELTGDDQPELVIEIGDCEFHCGNTHGAVYTWRDGRFVEITHANFSEHRIESVFGKEWTFWRDLQWAYKPAGGAQEILVARQELIKTPLNRRLHWNGAWYEVDQKWVEIYTDVSVDEGGMWTDWIGYAMEYGQLEQAQETLSTLQGVGSAFPDFTHFVMAYVKALQHEPDASRQLFQALVDTPADPQKRAVSAAAQTFLDHYQADWDVYRSCYAALQVFRDQLDPLRDENGAIDTDAMQDALGFASWSAPCSLRAAFRLLINELKLKPEIDVPAELERAGVRIQASTHLDLNNDDRQDWLLLLDMYGGERRYEPWLLLAVEQGFQALPVLEYEGTWPLSSQSEGPSLSDGAPFNVALLPLPGSKSDAVVLQYDANLIVFRIQSTTAGHEIEWLAWDAYVDHFELDPDATELHTFAHELGWDVYWKIYRWQAEHQAFQPVDPINRLIFEQRRYDNAIQALDAELLQLSRNDWEYAPKAAALRYLIALCFELNGNTDTAAKAYVQIWREFPGTPYALIAKAKLGLAISE